MLLCDFNCDLGEGMEHDAEIIPFLTSANIACGFHAGDEDTMKRTVELCLVHGVLIGAHPSYPDKDHFGRVDLMNNPLKMEEIPEIIFEQVNLLKRICSEAGTWLHHVKPHGALYIRAARDTHVSGLICQAIRDIEPSLILYGLSNSVMAQEARYHDLQFMHEVFADRTYQPDGALTPRSEPHAMISNSEEAVRQVLEMVKEKMVTTISGKRISVVAETVCIHGDGEHAVEFAKVIYQSLKTIDDSL